MSEGCKKYQHQKYQQRNININIGVTGVSRRREGYRGGGLTRASNLGLELGSLAGLNGIKRQPEV